MTRFIRINGRPYVITRDEPLGGEDPAAPCGNDDCPCFQGGLYAGWEDAYRWLNPNATDEQVESALDAFLASLDDE